MNEQADPYWRLRPVGATPDDEVCCCPPGTAVVLRDVLADNPLGCMTCNSEVPPERIGFDALFAEEIARWLSTYDSLYRLWLDSGEYEAWAAARLSDPKGQVNQTGRAIVERLNERLPAYYFWFVDTDAEPLTVCPLCASELHKYAGRDILVCSPCRIVV